MKKPVIGVLLHGSGAKDGSEIHESVFTMAALEMAGATVKCIAPKGPQHRVCNHFTGDEVEISRDMLEESARIARGEVVPLDSVGPNSIDGLVIPGGFGTAYNLCSFAEKGIDMDVRPDVTQLLRSLHEMKKPIGAICIAPVLLAKLFGNEKPKITLGGPGDVATAAEKMGVVHVVAKSSESVTDEALGFVSTPAYMHDVSVSEIFPGIQKLANEMVRLVSKRR